jgi:CRISPR/Cas system Type II protein with McrA/HNH and RuvC-like nuclease domain
MTHYPTDREEAATLIQEQAKEIERLQGELRDLRTEYESCMERDGSAHGVIRDYQQQAFMAVRRLSEELREEIESARVHLQWGPPEVENVTLANHISLLERAAKLAALHEAFVVALKEQDALSHYTGQSPRMGKVWAVRDKVYEAQTALLAFDSGPEEGR